jgi:ribonuclease P protein component
MTLFIVRRRSGRPRVTITASTAVGDAVRRNLVKRRLRGALEALGPVVPEHASLVIVARPGAAEAPYGTLAGELAAAIAGAARP